MTDWPGRSFLLAALALPLAALIAGLVIHALRAIVLGRAPVDAEVAGRGSSLLLGPMLRQGFAWTARPVERVLLRSGVTPDSLTIAGCVLCCAGALVLAAGDLTVGGLLVLASSAFDFLDGRLARARGSANPGGDFLDSTLDRYSDAFCFGGAAFFLREEPVALAACLVAFGAAAVVPYARAKAEALGGDLKGGLMQRAERVVIFSAAATFHVPLDGLWPETLRDSHPSFVAAMGFLAVATSATAISRTRDGVSRLREKPSPP